MNMKSLTKPIASQWLLSMMIALFGFLSCKKETKQIPLPEKIAIASNNNAHGHLKQAKEYSSNLVVRWLNMQLDMLRVPLAAGTGSQASERCQAYCGIVLYESVLPGMPPYRSLSGQLTDFPEMPATERGKAYHWAASANAALAAINRKLFPATSEVNITSMNNLESSLQAVYATEVDSETLKRSIAFGKEVAARVYGWAATDGSANINPAYVPAVGPGLWVPTASTPPIGTYQEQRRLLVPHVEDGTTLESPPAYSADPNSAFYAMFKDVYDKSLTLTADQTATAIYYRDAPGYPGGGHFVSILSQLLTTVQPALDFAALLYAKVGIGQYDASVICFRNKYHYNQIRPITYIRNEMGHPGWSPLIPTPNHPEFPSAHAVNNASVVEMLTNMFGDNFHFALHTYDYLGLPARSFNSFYEMGKEMSNSRVFGGIHCQSSCDKGSMQGKRVAQNILNTIRFLKDE
jgi:hypothetical protein